MNKFAIYADRVMKERGWNQAELVRRSGLSRQLVSNFFSEKSKEPDRETLEGVAEGLGIPLDLFYTESGVLPPKEDTTPIIEETIHVMKNLPEDDQADVLRYARMREQLAEERRQSASSKRVTTPRSG